MILSSWLAWSRLRQKSGQTAGHPTSYDFKIVFVHPVTKEIIEINAPVPNDVIWNAI